MKRKYTLIIISLLIGLFIYLFYRTSRTVVNELVIRIISLDTYMWLKGRVAGALPLPAVVVYSLPEALWVFCITLTSRPYYFEIYGRRVRCVFIPMLFCIGLEVMQLLSVTNGRFDLADIILSLIFWLTGAFVLADNSPRQNMLSRPNLRVAICVASYGIVYLAHVIKQ